MFLYFKNISKSDVHIYSHQKLLDDNYCIIENKNLERYVYSSLNMKSIVILAKDYNEIKITKAIGQNKGLLRYKEFILIKSTQKKSFKNELNYLISH